MKINISLTAFATKEKTLNKTSNYIGTKMEIH